MEFFTNLKYRLVREYEELSTAKKVLYSVGIIGATVLAVLLLSGAWEPFAVQTTTVIPKKGH